MHHINPRQSFASNGSPVLPKFKRGLRQNSKTLTYSNRSLTPPSDYALHQLFKKYPNQSPAKKLSPIISWKNMASLSRCLTPKKSKINYIQLPIWMRNSLKRKSIVNSKQWPFLCGLSATWKTRRIGCSLIKFKLFHVRMRK